MIIARVLKTTAESQGYLKGGRGTREVKVKFKERFEDTTWLAFKREEGAPAEACRQLLQAGNGKKLILPRNLHQAPSPADTWVSAQYDPFGTSDF